MKCWLAASGVLICTRTQGCAREGESIVSPWHEDGNWRRVLGSLYPRINHGITDCFGLGMTSRILQLQPHGQEGLDPTCVHQTEGTAGEILQSFIPCCSWISPGRGTPSSDPDPRSGDAAAASLQAQPKAGRHPAGSLCFLPCRFCGSPINYGEAGIPVRAASWRNELWLSTNSA